MGEDLASILAQRYFVALIRLQVVGTTADKLGLPSFQNCQHQDFRQEALSNNNRDAYVVDGDVE